MLARLFVPLQYLLPKYLMTEVVYRLARVRWPALKNAMIRGFVRLFDIDMDEAAEPDIEKYATLNAFFTRELADGQRPIDDNPDRIVSPADGTISVADRLDGRSIVQAKGIDYSLDDLLAIDLEEAGAFTDGRVATIYLAPYNYHRVHMPCDGVLRAAHYVPGDLFSVNAATAAGVRGLFRRNERLNLHFDTAFGPMAVIFVGALNVGSITTPWTGEIRPRKSGIDIGELPVSVSKGDLLGWFNMGSTVIVLLPSGACEWLDTTVAGKRVVVGEALAERPAASDEPAS